MSTPSVSFLGLGLMGLPMARVLASKGFSTRLWNRSAGKGGELAAEFPGLVTNHETIEAAVTPGGIVVSMVANDAALEELAPVVARLLGSGGLHISCSTVSPPALKLANATSLTAGGQFVAAPVFGRPPAAAAGTLVIVVSAVDAAPIERARPVLAALSRRLEVVSVSDVGAAGVAKVPPPTHPPRSIRCVSGARNPAIASL
jgi:3-hydroxyisobutyrate dehydrogenase-like beta-hydroxyacid dehydrogenase